MGAVAQYKGVVKWGIYAAWEGTLEAVDTLHGHWAREGAVLSGERMTEGGDQAGFSTSCYSLLIQAPWRALPVMNVPLRLWCGGTTAEDVEGAATEYEGGGRGGHSGCCVVLPSDDLPVDSQSEAPSCFEPDAGGPGGAGYCASGLGKGVFSSPAVWNGLLLCMAAQLQATGNGKACT
ncbi:hypothetical protein JB92DRAFT_2830948 [Gautieria morchelliformis]|nr:hypothetical protein JB92DRAFT_2830948 [Gautieria morchelliformis]